MKNIAPFNPIITKHIDTLEDVERKENKKINTLAKLNLLAYKKKHPDVSKNKVVHITTDYIFYVNK